MALSAGQKANKIRMQKVSARAKEIYEKNPKMKWTDCTAKAYKELKKEGKV